MIHEIIFKKDFFSDVGDPCVIVYDIGGTNCNAGLFECKEGIIRPVIIVRYKSREFSDAYKMLLVFQQYLIEVYGKLSVVSIVIAAAGWVYADSSQCVFTNIPFVFEKKHIEKISLFTCPVILMNDFEVIWHGIPLIDRTKLVALNKVLPTKYGTIGIVGAGTGLGKSIIGFDCVTDKHVVIRSEGGHQAFPIWTCQEYELVNFIVQSEKKDTMVTWEEILSGNGISRIYQFFLRQYSNLLAANKPYPHPDEIFNERHRDQACFETYQLYARLYARCIREFALEILPSGGLYIAGGIAAHNEDMFKSESFMQEFLNHAKHRKFLESVSLVVIADYNVSLYGAAWSGFNYKRI